MMMSLLESWTVHTRQEIRFIRNFQWITWWLLLFIIILIINSTPCHHLQEYKTCVLLCYLQEPFTWLHESKRVDRTTTKTSLRTSWLKRSMTCSPTTPTSSNEHSTYSHSVFHHLIVPNLYVCMCMREYLGEGVCRIKLSTVTSDDDLPYVCILHYLHLVGYQLVSITSNITHKRSCKRSTQHNVINS